MARYRSGDWDGALAALEKWNQFSPNGPNYGWYFLAMAHWQRGEKEQARQWYDRAVQSIKNNPKLYEDFPTAEKLVRFRAEAAKLLGVGDSPLGDACRARGHLHFNERRWEQAVAEYSRAIELGVADWEVRANRGTSYIRLGQWQKAAVDQAKAVELQPASFYARFLLAGSLVLSGDAAGNRRACADALKWVAEGEERNPTHVVVRACGLAPDAVTDAAVLVRLMEGFKATNRNGWSLHALGLAHYRAKQYEKAIARLEESRKVDPSWDEQTCVNGLVLALAHHQLGHANEARQWLDKTVERLEKGARDKGLTPPLSTHIVDVLSCLILRREAEAKIGKPAAKPDAKK